MTNPTQLLRSREIPFNYEIDWKASLSVAAMKLLWLEQSFLMQT
ncbi:hypothetical protein [Nostoc sp.]